jgi:hypothetical protein
VKRVQRLIEAAVRRNVGCRTFPTTDQWVAGSFQFPPSVKVEAEMDESNRLTRTKEQWARARRGGEEREVFYEGDDRLPPGQHLVDNFPVLDLGFKPEIP